MAADGDGSKSLPFRCLAATRYAVASVVTVLILLAVVKAIKVVHRPTSLSLEIAQGAMFMKRLKEPSTTLVGDAELNLRYNNPSIRTIVYYSNITLYCFDRNTPAWSSRPAEDSLVYFQTRDKTMSQQQGWVDSFLKVSILRGALNNASVLDFLYYSKTDSYMSDVTLRLEGNLTTQTSSGFNSTPRWTTFYCWPLFFGVDPENTEQVLSLNLKDVFCREEQGAHFI